LSGRSIIMPVSLGALSDPAIFSMYSKITLPTSSFLFSEELV
jgi:hypothetical protein